MSERQGDFAKGYAQLEKIVADLEARDIDLEKDLPKFEEGLALATDLQKRLKQLENKVEEISDKHEDG